MSRASQHPKEESFNFRVPADLKIAFQKATEAADRPAAQVIRDFMRAYINANQKPEPGHEEWFRAQVQEAIDDPTPSIPHDSVMKHVTSVMDTLKKKNNR